ncbi:phage portal protein [Thermoactinomyces sp. CICC 23799]|jgi:hypothetical protein|uniref:phage portal protein n=1 Tax=Thermoactinomyces sp. CICC 23799 TaxID=2767429 RepID=UPI001E548BBF|nr:phage portal protein [Thermoactinomyces sp. CICC 23799]
MLFVDDESKFEIPTLTHEFKEGGIYPSEDERVLRRLAKYKRGKLFFQGNQEEMFERASEALKGTKHESYLRTLYIACNLQDILLTKPADLMFGEPPIYDISQPDETPTKQALNEIVKRNRLNKLGHELVISGGYRGDSWIKVRYGYRDDFSEVPKELLPEGVSAEEFLGAELEPIIESVPAEFVFPEESSRDRNRFKAINIAFVEWVLEGKEEVPYLFVERHVPGFITYSRFRMTPLDVQNIDSVPIMMYRIQERVPTGMEQDIIPTGLNYIPVWHVPYKSVDDTWEGISFIEKAESIIQAINDRLVQIDYILWKHGDPPAYGPRLTGENGTVSWAGRYIPLENDQPQPGYMQFDSRLEGQFKELDYLINILYQMAETPQWLFGTTITENSGGTGTSHTDGVAIQSRFMPILSKVKRIRVHVDYAFKNAIKTALELKALNQPELGIEPEEPIIHWKDGLPKNKKEEAEIMALRTGDKPTLDVKSAIKRLDEVEDKVAETIIEAIQEDEARLIPQAMPSVPLEEVEGGDE